MQGEAKAADQFSSADETHVPPSGWADHWRCAGSILWIETLLNQSAACATTAAPAPSTGDDRGPATLCFLCWGFCARLLGLLLTLRRQAKS